MSKISVVNTGAYTGNRLSTEAAAQGLKNIGDQMVLNATIERINKTKSAFDAVPKEGKRISGSINARNSKSADEASKNADQLKNILDKAISSVHDNIAKVQQDHTTLYKASSAQGGGAGAAETGKGTNVNVKS